MNDNIKKCYVLVNATALSSGGALTILRQFISYASLSSKQYLIFTPLGVSLDKHLNITYVEIDTKSWFKRIWWDSFGLRKYIKKAQFNYSLCICLQNTSVNVDCEQLIYVHQPLPFTTVKYKINKETVKFFLYKWFYKFFIFLFSTNKTRFVVQTKWMKSALLQSGVGENNIFIFTPDIKLPSMDGSNVSFNTVQSTNKLDVVTFFYPASTLFYKNHLLILDALALLKRNVLNKAPVFSVSFEYGAYPDFDDKVSQLNLANNVEYMGVISYEDVVKKYVESNAVLFPSYIETFGLPLAEAGVLGKKIICVDLPYSRDVLDNYLGATFLDYQNPKVWADEMESIINQPKILTFPPLSFSNCKTWKDFFDFI